MEHRGVELGSCLQSTRREWDITRPEWDTKNLKACDFRKPLRRFRRYQSQNGSRYFSTDHPVDGLRLTVAQLYSEAPAATIAVLILLLDAEYLSSIAMILLLRSDTDLISGRAISR